MPEMDGLDATAKIREAESLKQRDKQRDEQRIPIIALTAHALKGDREHCRAVGMDDYLSKPLDPDDVLATVERWLARDHQQAHPKVNLKGETQLVRETHLARETHLVDAVEQAQETASSGEPILLDKTMPRFGNDRDFFKEMLDEFITSLNERIPAFQAVVQEDDCTKMAQQAHSLKGTASNFSAEPLTTYAREMELQAKAGNLTAAATWIDKIENEIPRLQAFLERQKQQLR